MKIMATARHRVDNEEGFAFVMALLCMLLMTSLGVLIFSLTMKDQVTSVKLAAEAKTSSAAEHAVTQMLTNFTPNSSSGGSADSPASWPHVAGSADAGTRFYYRIPSESETDPVTGAALFRPCQAPSGESLTVSMGKCYETDVRGAHVNFVSQHRVAVGVRVGAVGKISDAEQ